MITMKPQYSFVGSRFWFQWMLASILGFAVGAAMDSAIANLITPMTCTQSSLE